MKPSLFKLMYALLVISLFAGGLFWMKRNPSPTPLKSVFPSPTTVPLAVIPEEIATVSAVIDGDTIELSDKRRVRYIGIDTPETKHPTKGVQCFGVEASRMNAELVLGKTIRMQKDVSETDRYGRLLRYVWVDKIFVNDYLARNGYALQATFPPDVAHAEEFRIAAAEARAQDRGLWKACR